MTDEQRRTDAERAWEDYDREQRHAQRPHNAYVSYVSGYLRGDANGYARGDAAGYERAIQTLQNDPTRGASFTARVAIKILQQVQREGGQG